MALLEEDVLHDLFEEDVLNHLHDDLIEVVCLFLFYSINLNLDFNHLLIETDFQFFSLPSPQFYFMNSP